MADITRRHRNHRTQWTIAEITFVEQPLWPVASDIGEICQRKHLPPDWTVAPARCG